MGAFFDMSTHYVNLTNFILIQSYANALSDAKGCVIIVNDNDDGGQLSLQYDDASKIPILGQKKKVGEYF